jgi:hypothetical protein
MPQTPLLNHSSSYLFVNILLNPLLNTLGTEKQNCYTHHMESKPYDIVLLPENNLGDKIVSISQSLENYTTHFTLNQQNFFAHLSLYMLQLNEDGVARACKLLQAAATEIKTQKLHPKCYHYENEYLDIEYEKTEELSVLQNNIISLLNPIRNGLREKDEIRLQTAIGIERMNLLTYGYRSVGSEFSPHVTFTRFTSEQRQTLMELPLLQELEGKFNRIGIFQMGDNGTCTTEVQTYSLS